MSTVTAPRISASDILAATGISEDFTFYGSFTSELEKAVLTVPLRIQAAWAANDPDIFADIFAENGSLLMKDRQLTSREEIRGYMAAGFSSMYRGAQVTGWPLVVTFLDEDVAIVVTQGGILLAGDTELAREREIRALWVIIERDGQWVLMSYQSSPVGG